MPFPIRVSLEKNSSRSHQRGVGGDSEWFRQVGENEDRFLEKKCLQVIEGLLAGGRPVPLGVLFGEIDERSCDGRIIVNESPVVIGES